MNVNPTKFRKTSLNAGGLNILFAIQEEESYEGTGISLFISENGVIRRTSEKDCFIDACAYLEGVRYKDIFPEAKHLINGKGSSFRILRFLKSRGYKLHLVLKRKLVISKAYQKYGDGIYLVKLGSSGACPKEVQQREGIEFPDDMGVVEHFITIKDGNVLDAVQYGDDEVIAVFTKS